MPVCRDRLALVCLARRVTLAFVAIGGRVVRGLVGSDEPLNRPSNGVGYMWQQEIGAVIAARENGVDAFKVRLVAVMRMIVKNATWDAGELKIFSSDRKRQSVAGRKHR
jgi:hypothetical protein